MTVNELAATLRPGQNITTGRATADEWTTVELRQAAKLAGVKVEFAFRCAGRSVWRVK